MSRPSATAALVLRGIAFQAGHPAHRHLVPADAAAMARDFVRAAGVSLRRGDSIVDRFRVALVERLFVPGLTLHYVLRKKRIEELVRTAIDDGFRQLVVLGAGFDTLALRLGRQIRAIEIDRAETQAIKRTVAGESAPVTFVPADLERDSISDKLKPFDLTSPALFLAEAVFLYLTPPLVHRVLQQIRRAAPRARVVFTFFEGRRSRPNFRNATLLADLWLRWKGEPVRWGIDPADVEGFVGADGFRVEQLVLDDEYHHGFAAAKGEHIAVVEIERPEKA